MPCGGDTRLCRCRPPRSRPRAPGVSIREGSCRAGSGSLPGIESNRVPIRRGVTVGVDAERVLVKGRLGALGGRIRPDIAVGGGDGKAVVERTADTRQHRALRGLVRNEIRNMIEGVTKGFERVLEINGVGYKAALSGRTLSLNLGFTHPIAFPLPEGIEAKVDKQTVVTIRGRDRYLVGQIAANIRALKKPDVYKAKGVKYAGEILLRKEGTTGK